MDTDQYEVDMESRYPDYSDMNRGGHLFYPGDKMAVAGGRFSDESNRRYNEVETRPVYAPKVESCERKLRTLPLRARTLTPNTMPNIGPVRVGDYGPVPPGVRCGSGGLCCEGMIGGVGDAVNNAQGMFFMFIVLLFVFTVYNFILLRSVGKQLGKITKLLRTLKTA